MLAEILHKIGAQQYQEKGNNHYKPRPSLAGPERCIRQMVYWRLDTPAKPLPGRGVFIFDDSNWHEELTADWIRQSAYKLHSQQMVVEAMMDGFPFTLKGKIDGILEDFEGNESLWEHKAVSHFSWNEMAKGVPHTDYLAQDSIYLRGLHIISPQIRDLTLLIKNKNTAQYLEFIATYFYDHDELVVRSMHTSTEGMEETEINKSYPNIVRDCFAKFQAVEDYASSKELPRRQYDKDHWRCEYCQYHETCWANYEAEFQALAVGADLQDMEELCAYYLETSSHANEMRKENEELKEKIKKALAEKGVREGTTARYLIKNNLVKSMRIDKTLIPATILAYCEKESFSERLSINLKNEFKKKGGEQSARINRATRSIKGQTSPHNSKRISRSSYEGGKLPDNF